MSLNGMKQQQGEKRADFIARCRAVQFEQAAKLAGPRVRRQHRKYSETIGEDQSVGDYERFGPDREMEF